MPPKVRDLLSDLERAGWRCVHQVGSHRQYKHPMKPGKLTVVGQMNDHVHPKTLKQIRKALEE